MILETSYSKFGGILTSKKESKLDMQRGIKLTSSYKQVAQNRASNQYELSNRLAYLYERQENTIRQLANIEVKKAKKQQFFNSKKTKL